MGAFSSPTFLLLLTGCLAACRALLIGDNETATRHLVRWSFAASENCTGGRTAVLWFPGQDDASAIKVPFMNRLTFNASTNSILLKPFSVNNGCWLSTSIGVGKRPTLDEYVVRNITGFPSVAHRSTSRITVKQGQDATLNGAHIPNPNISEWEFISGNSSKLILQHYWAQGTTTVYTPYKGRTQFDKKNNILTLRNTTAADTGRYKSTVDLSSATTVTYDLTVVSTETDAHDHTTLGPKIQILVQPRTNGNPGLWIGIALCVLTLIPAFLLWYFRDKLCEQDPVIEIDMPSEPGVTIHILRDDETDP